LTISSTVPRTLFLFPSPLSTSLFSLSSLIYYVILFEQPAQSCKQKLFRFLFCNMHFVCLQLSVRLSSHLSVYPFLSLSAVVLLLFLIIFLVGFLFLSATSATRQEASSKADFVAFFMCTDVRSSSFYLYRRQTDPMEFMKPPITCKYLCKDTCTFHFSRCGKYYVY